MAAARDGFGRAGMQAANAQAAMTPRLVTRRELKGVPVLM
jgi:hypothetical protein